MAEKKTTKKKPVYHNTKEKIKIADKKTAALLKKKKALLAELDKKIEASQSRAKELRNKDNLAEKRKLIKDISFDDLQKAIELYKVSYVLDVDELAEAVRDYQNKMTDTNTDDEVSVETV